MLQIYRAGQTFWCAIPKAASAAIVKATEAIGPVEKDIHLDWLKWTVVRNPYARAHSMWRALFPHLSFQDFLVEMNRRNDRTERDPHLRSQWYYLQPFQPDLVLRFEELEESWPLFSSLHGFSDLGRWNVSRRPLRDYSYHESDCSEFVRSLIQQRYWCDFTHLGYPL